jgi:hypothetical protein
MNFAYGLVVKDSMMLIRLGGRLAVLLYTSVARYSFLNLAGSGQPWSSSLFD